MKRTGYWKWLMPLLLALLWPAPLYASAEEPQTVRNSPYVSFSPDGKAWTTNAGDKSYIHYAEGTSESTGIRSSLPSPKRGEHYYRYARTGIVPVEHWTVRHKYAQCIHNAYLSGDVYHGIPYRKQHCGKYYYSGWIAYCADCQEPVADHYFYMSSAAARSIDYLEISADLDYYYLCPHCRNLEQGRAAEAHWCKQISPNQYRVVYHPNTEDLSGGHMPGSIHMYNNAQEYEGRTVTPVRHLTKNTYTRIGYEFSGWNTKPDGSGTAYKDKAEILNLSAADWREESTWTASDNGTVDLYAQWVPSRSTLKIDPNGGTYEGSRGITSVSGEYGSVYRIRADRLKAPSGNTVSFVTNGGEAVAPVTGTQYFTEWSLSAPFYGRLSGENYSYYAPDGGQDTVTANYERNPIVLPAAKREGYSFGGWYYDSGFSKPAGGAGEKIVPAENIKLYAQWVNLTLSARDNYTAHGGKGAVDLSWSQKDNRNKTYMVYQSRNGKDWTRVNAADDISDSRSVNLTYGYTGKKQEYTVPYTGLYTVTASGAQGGNYGKYSGGAGGSVTAGFWLQKGEVLTYTVGGRNGYNGGGAATSYGNGGGCTVVSSNRGGVLIIAGGGGGASENGSGGAGGSAVSLTDGRSGQNGMAGGGGGDRGGTSGQVVVHRHTGNSQQYGGCYTVAKKCGGTSFTKNREFIKRYNNSNYYDVQKGIYVRGAYCPQCGNNSCSGHNYYKNRYICDTCGAQYENDRPEYCVVLFGYDPGCGHTDGQVISSYPAYGGSSYVNTALARSYDRQAGVNRGDGKVSLHSETIGFVDTLKLNGVRAADLAPPAAVARKVVMEPVGGLRVKMVWNPPEDNGTEYFHMVKSYIAGSERPVCSSNVTRNVLASGVAGYYYLVDGAPQTAVTPSNGKFTPDSAGTTELSGTDPAEKRYLHVAAVDRAGNLGKTAHICIESGDGRVPWRLFTEQLEPEAGENVCPAGEKNTFYVRSDGDTAFALNYRARMDGAASADYQQNYVIFEASAGGLTGRNILYAPSHAIRDGRIGIRAEELEYSQQGESVLKNYPYTAVSRSDRNRRLEAVQQFVLDPALSGAKIRVIPVAGADRSGSVVYSEYESDKKNGITLIADGEAPVIHGLEKLTDRKLIDRRDGSLVLIVSAEDDLSGVKELYLSIVNGDNGAEKICRPGPDGSIRVEVTADDPIFSGDFTVTAIARDNVGNRREVSLGTTEFALEAHVERMLAPHDAAFKSGESGILSLSVWGYADRVEVEFPEEWTAEAPQLNKVYSYTEAPAYLHREELQFMIPLNVPAGRSYTVTVRAYKGDRKLEEYPAVSVLQIDGTVLDELRTRLR